jgi:hypothetical protein
MALPFLSVLLTVDRLGAIEVWSQVRASRRSSSEVYGAHVG